MISFFNREIEQVSPVRTGPASVYVTTKSLDYNKQSRFENLFPVWVAEGTNSIQAAQF